MALRRRPLARHLFPGAHPAARAPTDRAADRGLCRPVRRQRVQRWAAAGHAPPARWARQWLRLNDRRRVAPHREGPPPWPVSPARLLPLFHPSPPPPHPPSPRPTTPRPPPP